MRREPDFFGDVDLDLVYIAKKLREALKLEDIFTQAGIDYLVEPDRYRGGFLFVSERIGAFFYVAPETLEQAQAVMAQNRYKPYRPA
jgi:prenyltransferase beta subunit